MDTKQFIAEHLNDDVRELALKYSNAKVDMALALRQIEARQILRKKVRPCLDFHIGKCRGCCIGAVSIEEYGTWIDEVTSLLKGGVGDILRSYRERMLQASEALDFETAQEFKEKIASLEKHYSHSIISAARDTDADVFSLIFEGAEAFGNFLRIRSGAVVQSLNLGFKMNIEEEQASVLSAFLAEIESKFGQLSKEVIVPFMPDVDIPGVEFRIPVKGDKLALLSLSVKNAKEFQFNSLKQREHTDPDAFRAAVVEEIRVALGMKESPVRGSCIVKRSGWSRSNPSTSVTSR